MRMLGDKVAARKVAAKVKVPTVPGMNEPLTSVDQATKLAEKPVIYRNAIAQFNVVIKK